MASPLYLSHSSDACWCTHETLRTLRMKNGLASRRSIVQCFNFNNFHKDEPESSKSRVNFGVATRWMKHNTKPWIVQFERNVALLAPKPRYFWPHWIFLADFRACTRRWFITWLRKKKEKPNQSSMRETIKHAWTRFVCANFVSLRKRVKSRIDDEFENLFDDLNKVPSAVKSLIN